MTAGEKLSIHTLIFSNNDLEHDGARAFSEYLSKSETLKNLVCTGCHLGDKSAKLMLENAIKNPKLQLENLIFDNNDLGI